MIREIESLYNISVDSIIKKTKKTYLVFSDGEEYLLKFYENQEKEIVFEKLSLLNIEHFVLPIKNNLNKYFFVSDGNYYALFNAYYDEDVKALDLRFNFYIKAIALLHSKSSYSMKINDGFFTQSINYLDNEIARVKNEFNSYISIVEKQNYHSPSEWYFINTYNIFINAIKEADRYVTLLEDEWSENKNIHLSLIYQNMSFDHIIAKSEKIVSLDNLCIGPSSYDLLDAFNKALSNKIDFIPYLKLYLEIHPLEKYEIYWCLALFYIPVYKKSEDEIQNIYNMYTSIKRIEIVNEIASIFCE